MRSIFALLALFAAAPALSAQPVLYHDAVVHTVDNEQPTASAFVVDGGRFVAVGDVADLLATFPDAERRSLGGAVVVPGLIDAHAHLLKLGRSLLRADLVATTSAQDIVSRLQAFEEKVALPDGAWLLGPRMGPERLGRRFLGVGRGLPDARRPRRRVSGPPRLDRAHRRARGLG